MPPLLLGFLLAGWTMVPALAGYWTVLALVLAGGQPLAGCLPGFVGKPREKPWLLHVRDQGIGLLRVLWVEAFSLSVLPYVAQRHVDAIARTLYRLCVSKRRLLEWITASDAETSGPDRCRDHYAAMWSCQATGLAVMALLAIVSPPALTWAGPLLAAWLAGPLLAWRVSRPNPRPEPSLANVHELQVRRWARQTWGYFETFVNGREHWLPPDNVQEHSGARVATRTSPTNIGVGLLSGLAAYDLGYLPGTALIKRTRGALHTMRRLQRFRGHLYNWYETRTLQPVEPRYVSSVDSGNLWGALTVLAVGLDELRDRPVVPFRFLEGLYDTLEVIASLRATSPSPRFDDPFDACLGQLRCRCTGPSPRSARVAHEVLSRVRALAATLASAAPVDRPALRQWTKAFLRQSAAVHQEILRWAFWLRMPRRTPDTNELHDWIDGLDANCTLGALPEAAGQFVDHISQLPGAVSEGGDRKADVGRPRSVVLALVRRAAEQAASAARSNGQRSPICRAFAGNSARWIFVSFFTRSGSCSASDSG